jgi:RecB family exonuclease
MPIQNKTQYLPQWPIQLNADERAKFLAFLSAPPSYDREANRGRYFERKVVHFPAQDEVGH